MPRSPALRLFFCVCVGAAAGGSVLFACSEERPSSNATQADGGEPRPDGGRSNGDPDDAAAVDETKDASPRDGALPSDATPPKDANGPGEAGTICAFNRECQLALRCECDDNGCTCKPGPRGTGRNGIDRCDSGEQCASSLCVEGPNGTDHFCSDECQGPADCTGALPRCAAIGGFPEPICIREPP